MLDAQKLLPNRFSLLPLFTLIVLFFPPLPVWGFLALFTQISLIFHDTILCSFQRDLLQPSGLPPCSDLVIML